MVEKEISVPTADGDMTTFVVRPQSDGPFPVAVIFMDGVGYREQVKKNAQRFAADGYYCVAPDLYHRMGERLSFDMSKLATDGMKGPEAEKMMAAATSVTPEAAVADTKAVLTAIASDPAAGSGPKVCVGYCLGARVAMNVASALAEEFVAAAGIHPGALISDKPDSPHRGLASVRGELEQNGVRGVVERLPGTTHGFAMADLPVYNEEAAEHHFERTLDLWKRNLSQEPVQV